MKGKHLEPGGFCWADVAVSEPKVIHLFFSQLFGWSRRVRPTDDAQAYSIMTSLGHHVMGICHVEEAEQSQWMSYLLVEDLAEATAKAQELGATVVNEKIEISTFGTMTIVQDPSGVLFALWQSKQGEYSKPRLPGQVAWFELMTDEPKLAQDFYSRLAHWTEQPQSDDESLTVFYHHGKPVSSLRKKESPEIPSAWVVYFLVDDCDETAAKCESLGGKVFRAKSDCPHLGRCALLQDPSGGIFGIIAAES